MKDCTTGTLSQLPLSSDAASVGLSSSAAVYCSKTSDPQQDTPPTFRLDASLSQCTEPNERSRKFSELPVSEKAKIYRLLQILDRFYISDATYHEVMMTFPDLPMPKSSLVKQSRADLNNLTTLNTIDHGSEADTNGSSSSGISGARISLEEAIALEISLYLSEHPNEGSQTMRIKLAGDGASMTRHTSYQMFSFSLLNWGADVLSPSHVRAVAVVVGQESYENLRDGMRDVFQEVNELIDEKKMKVGGKNINLEFSSVATWNSSKKCWAFKVPRPHMHASVAKFQKRTGTSWTTISIVHHLSAL